jgi:folylpolyglutamate synthase/dihydropteroate synthase
LKGFPARLRTRFTPEAISRGLARAPQNSGLRGRFEILAGGLAVADVAHNPSAMKVLVHALRSRHIRPASVLLGALTDKDVPSMVATLGVLDCPIVAVRPETERGMGARALVLIARSVGVQAFMSATVQAGMRRARKLAGPKGSVLITGSHYVVGPALRIIETTGRRVRRGKRT